MGTLSVNRLGGLSLIVGPILVFVAYMLSPGVFLIDQANPADATAVITALISNASLAHLTAFGVTLGVMLFVVGFQALQGTIKGGNGDALSRLGLWFVTVAAVGWVFSAGLTHVLAGNAGQAGGAIYATQMGISQSADGLASLGLLAIALATSTRDDFNKIISLVVAVAAIVNLIVVIIGGTDATQMESLAPISSVCYLIFTIWAVTLGLGMLKKA